jgi:DUF1680 family protein
MPGIPALRFHGSRLTADDQAALYTDELPKRTLAPVTLIPFFAWANRGEGEMCVWILQEQK